MPQKNLFLFVCLIGLYLINNNYAWAAIAARPEAKEGISLEDRIISSLFKAMAKTFLLTADFESLKNNNIDKLNKMDEEKFRKKYNDVYEAVKHDPLFKNHYGFSENMTKEQAIKKIQQVHKQEIYEIIDAIPDSVIAGQFRLYLFKKKQEISRNNVYGQISQFWSSFMQKLNKE